MTAAAPVAVALACTTKTREFYRTKYDLFGDPIYDYVNRTQWCYSGSKVVSIYQAYADLRNEAWGIYLEDPVYSSSGVRANGTAWHNEKHRVDYCVFVYGCYTSTYPHIDTELSGSSIWVTSSADS